MTIKPKDFNRVYIKVFGICAIGLCIVFAFMKEARSAPISSPSVLITQLPQATSFDKLLANIPEFVDDLPFYISSDTLTTYDMAWGDMDGDGDLDLAVGNNSNQANQIYRNDGQGNFTTLALPSAGSTTSVAWGDMDGDGDLDLAVGNYHVGQGISQINQLYRNDGDSVFSIFNLGTEAQDTQSVAWGDMDGDGDLDLAVGNSTRWNGSEYVNGENRVYRNDGNGKFVSIVIGSPSENTHSIAWGDMDNDGDLDLAVGNNNQINRIYRNEGGGLFLPLDLDSLSQYTQSVAWGDMDDDGNLDLAVGNANQPNRIYRNLGDENFISYQLSNSAYATMNVKWGDIDSDGDLDLAVINGHVNESNQIYRNDGNGNFSISDFGTTGKNGISAAWGDVDGDGDLDLAVGNTNQVNEIYRNVRGISLIPRDLNAPSTLTTNVVVGDMEGDGDFDILTGQNVYRNDNNGIFTPITHPNPGNGSIVAWADIDGDGDLDIAVGHVGIKLYRNEGSGAFVPLSINSGTKIVSSLAWGDMDSDGDIDLVVGNRGTGPPFRDVNQLYRNDGNGVFTALELGTDEKNTQDIALGDIDNDGDLDIVFGNGYEPNQIYWNRGGTVFAPDDLSNVAKATASIDLGDFDGDGDLDIAVGNGASSEANQLYRNDGNGIFIPFTLSTDTKPTTSIAWGDVDGDGDLDLAVGNSNHLSQLYRNDGNGHFSTSDLSIVAKGTSGVAWGDMDGDGDLDLVATNGNNGANQADQIYINPLRGELFSPNNNPQIRIVQPHSSSIVSDTNIEVDYVLGDLEQDHIGRIEVFYSLNGGGHWFPALPTAETVTAHLETTKISESTSMMLPNHKFVWDTFASGFFGQSDHVVLRFVAYPQPVKSANDNTYQYTNGLPNSIQRPYVSTVTFPFRARGSQTRVLDEHNQGVADAIVFRLPAGQEKGALPYRDGNGSLSLTDNQGYLSGRGQLVIGDHLMALQPIQQTETHTLFHTSAPVTQSGVNAFVVSQAGVQTLQVLPTNPLLVFNLSISLEWDSSNDLLFQAQLKQDLLAASEALYDWTNGQVALGKVTVYQNKESWDEANIRILASNLVRPNANRGGVVREQSVITSPSLTEPITGTQGYVHIGPTWNRYGDAATLGRDWANVLAHELGHYLLWLEDTYLGLDEATGLLIPIDTCHGTAMSDPYEEPSSEFRYNDGAWQAECGNTLAELPEWDLITAVYPDLYAPPPTNSGPMLVPFAFTQVEIQAPTVGPTPLLIDDNIALGDLGYRLTGGRAYLIRRGERLVDLGGPVLNSVRARGARDGDELCIFGTANTLCTSLNSALSQQMKLTPVWTPEISLTPINTTTIQIFVNAPNSNSLTATLYPNGESPQTVILSSGVAKSVTLAQPAVDVLVDLQGDAPSQRIISGYTLGSGPGRRRSFDGPGRRRSFDGPVTTGDGRALLFPPEKIDNDTFMVLQAAISLPEPPAGLLPIGRSYHVRFNKPVTDFDKGSIVFQYVGLEILLSGAPEKELAIYFWDGNRWQRLQTILNQTQNIASAPLQGPGLYALMAGFHIPLYSYSSGWNLVSYPLQSSMAITQALASVHGFYTSVYEYDASNASDPWSRYSVTVPDWANDLHELKSDLGYWIQVTDNITWTVRPADSSGRVMSGPPATYYGTVGKTANFVPTAGMTIRAKINGNLCGSDQTREIDGQIMYAIDVSSEDGGRFAECGALGRLVTFEVDGQLLATTANWNNDQLWLLPLEQPLDQKIYLPIVYRE